MLQWKSNKYYTFWVCVCILRYPACNAHAPYSHLWPVQLCHIFPHFLINCTIFEKKNLLNTKFACFFAFWVLCVPWEGYQSISKTPILRGRKTRTRDLWNTRRETQIQTKLDQPPRKNGQHQTPETLPHLQTPRKKGSWTPQETMEMRRCRNMSNDLIHGGRWWRKCFEFLYRPYLKHFLFLEEISEALS